MLNSGNLVDFFDMFTSLAQQNSPDNMVQRFWILRAIQTIIKSDRYGPQV